MLTVRVLTVRVLPRWGVALVGVQQLPHTWPTALAPQEHAVP